MSESNSKWESKRESRWESVIGLEIHCQLNTKTKLFSSARCHYGDEPNHNIDPLSTGQPGTLPVINKAAVDKAIAFGCAIGAQVALFSKFDRKSYTYPDLPDGYQITQNDEPIICGGSVETLVDEELKSFDLERAHLENDTGMLKHFSSFTGIDYNRAGSPLLEIVTTPCIHSPEEAIAFAKAVRAIMHYLDASDCNMEEGSLRIDANISVRPKGSTQLRNKTEMKNLNSFNYLGKAIHFEIERQIAFYEADPEASLPSATYRWDAMRSEPLRMRDKNSAMDYRFFPEPNLPPLVLTKERIEAIRNTLPELPARKLLRFREELGLSSEHAELICSDHKLADYFECALKIHSAPTQIAAWITTEFAGRLKETRIYDSKIAPAHVAELTELIETGAITGKMAKAIADEMVTDPRSPKAIVKANPDYQPLTDTDETVALIDAVLAENPDSIALFKSGRERAFGFMVGQVMKKSGSKANPKLVSELLRAKLAAL
jgi:aspartyl-tRNA(Asn)/glutamyl-tRNA(Gln) amidotransferase subunit B